MLSLDYRCNTKECFSGLLMMIQTHELPRESRVRMDLQIKQNYLPTSCTASFSFSAQKDSSKSLSGMRCCLIRTLNGRV